MYGGWQYDETSNRETVYDVFFFSSRRRHTRYWRDWSSDVCSSDLHSTLNIVTGESGNFLSSNYMDQWKAWYEGYTLPFPFSMQAVENARVHELRLQP